MKNLLLGFLVLGSISTNAFSAQLFCRADGINEAFEGGLELRYNSGIKPVNRHALVAEKMVGECKSVKIKDGDIVSSKRFRFELVGYGPGLQVSDAYFSITCPTAKERNLTRNAFYGIKAGAGLLLGADAGVFSNKRLGTCVIAGLKVGFGAGISGARIRFID